MYGPSFSFYIKNEIELLGGIATILSVQKDIFDTLESTILEATKIYDLVIIGAGSSAGTKDYAKSIVEKNGNVYVHGIGIKPGKPTIIGEINKTPIVGLPGYPVSTFIAFDNVVKPIVLNFLNQELNTIQVVKAKLTKKVYSSLQPKRGLLLLSNFLKRSESSIKYPEATLKTESHSNAVISKPKRRTIGANSIIGNSIIIKRNKAVIKTNTLTRHSISKNYS